LGIVNASTEFQQNPFTILLVTNKCTDPKNKRLPFFSGDNWSKILKNATANSRPHSCSCAILLTLESDLEMRQWEMTLLWAMVLLSAMAHPR